MEEQIPGPFRHLQFLSSLALPVAAKAVAGEGGREPQASALAAHPSWTLAPN